jgi:hypothetical protein
MTQASRPPARAIISQRYGAVWSPKSEKGTVKRIGSGFQEGPPSVTRSRCAISRPHMIHAHGSYVGVDGMTSVTAATARQIAMSDGIEVARRQSSDRPTRAPRLTTGLARSDSRRRSGRSCAAGARIAG